MKRIFAFLVILCIMSSLGMIVSAEEAKVNVMSSAVVDEKYGLLSTGSYVAEHLFDGIRTYNSSLSATYCDFKFASSASAAMSETVVKYNIYGQTDKSDNIYLCTFRIVLDKVYSVSSFRFFGCSPEASSNIDGFDIWVSETGLEGSWTKIYSETNIYCGGKYTVSTEDGINTLCVSQEFTTIKAQYIIFGLTQPRCQHTEELAKLGLTPNANPNYFRITEIEMYGSAAGGETITSTPVTTSAPVTTKTPVTTIAPATTAAVTTEAPVTTKAPDVTTAVADNTGSGGCGGSLGAVFGVAVIVAGAAVAVNKKERTE